MPLEIERKFLLKKVPYNLKPDEVITIEQYYCSKNKELDFRIRKSINSLKEAIYTKTTKKRLSPGVFEELEFNITESQFKKYLKFAKSEIKKIRYIKKVGKLKWEIDFYTNIHLLVAEIELPDIKYPIKIPKFISKNLIMEITDIKQFSNKSLSNLLN